jgi:predicted TIM-barrel fold metal-dependent hydrolase
MLVELLGDDHIVWGTDYPHFDCNWNGAAERFANTTLSTPSINKILGLNALNFFNLKAPESVARAQRVMA